MNLNIKSYSIYLLVILMGSFSSCDKGFEDVNKSVDFVSEPNLDYMLPNIELTLLDNTYYTHGDFVAPLVMHVTNRKAYNALIIPGGYHGYHFEWVYENPLKSAVDLIYRTKDDPSKVNYNSMARILKVYLFQTLTDLYGDIPYFDGGQGYINRVFTPAYDPQQEIYSDMFKELDEATSAFDNTKTIPTLSDIVYKGDLDKWKKFSNSLMLRMGLRIMKADPINGKKWIEKAIAGGVLTSNDDNFIVKYLPNPSTGGTTNPTSNGQAHIFVRYPDNYRLTSQFINTLKDHNDPRITAYAMLAGSRTAYIPGSKLPANQKGWPAFGDRMEEAPYSGIPSADRVKYSVSNNTVFGRYDAPYIHLSYAQVQFQLAECVVRGIITSGTSAKTYYENGVRAAIDELKIYGSEGVFTAAQANDYLAQNPYDPATTEAALEMINLQYWIETHFNWYETFANMRRSGYPKFYDRLVRAERPAGDTDAYQPGNLGAIMPRRLTYQPAEVSTNPKLQEALQRQGPDLTSTRVWWDKE
jgi:hypothetical protein